MSYDASPARGQTRREVLAALGVGVAGGVLGSAAGASAAAPGTTDWPQAHADAANSGHLPDGRGPAADVRQGWTYNNDRYHDGLSVAEGTVYVGGKSLAAVDAETGAEQWTFTPEEGEPEGDDEGNMPEFGTPAVADGQVYGSVGFGVYDGTTPGDDLVAVGAESGTERWRFDPSGSTRISDPTVADSTVYVRYRDGDGGREEGTTLAALTPDGSVRWQRDLAYRGSRTPVCVGENLVFAPGEEGVTALDRGTGETVWKALPRVSFDRGPQPVVAGGTLYVAETNGPGATLIALDAATGDDRWRRAFGNQDHPRLTVGATDDDGIYVQWDGTEADVIALSTDGTERWRTTVTAEGENTRVWTAGLARAGDLLFAGESAIDPADGSVVWKRATDEASAVGWRLDAVSGGRSYLVGEEVRALVGSGDDGTPTATTTGTPTATRTVPPDTNGDVEGTATATATPRSGSDDGGRTTRPGAESPPGTTTGPATATATANEGTATATATGGVSTVTGTTGTTGPGFGALAALAGVGSAVAALARRRDDEE